jgi:hypothetical protein
MGSKANSYASVSIEQIKSNTPGGLFVYNNGLLSGTQNIISRYQQGINYRVEYTGQRRVAGNIQTVNGIVFLGEFSSQYALEDAFDAYVGFAWNRAFRAETQNDYYGMLAFLDGHQFNEAAWGIRGAYDYVNVWQLATQSNANSLSFEKPCYTDLISGYYLDARSFPSIKQLTPPETKRLRVEYYRQNSAEGIDGLTTIDWYHYDIELIKGKPIYLPLERPVLGTLWVDDPVIEGLIKAMPHLPTEYPVSVYFPSDIPGLFNYWQSLYAIEEAKLVPVGVGNLIGQFDSNSISSTVKILGANNNVWNNGAVINDVGFDPSHPMFAVNEQLAFKRYFKPQVDGSFGDLVMNSPKLDDLWTHFCSQTPALNELDNTLPRLNTHGHLIQETANRIGYQPDANGIIDSEVQKTVHETKSADIRKPLDKENYSPYGFGKKGLAIANLPNDHDGSNPKNGGGSLVTNLPNLMLELHSQINKAFDIQASSNITFSVNDRKVHYTNQAALLVDLARTVAMLSPLVNTIYANSLQTESQVREIIGALGLGTTDDSIGLNINGQSVNLPFKGVDRRESIVNELADIKLTLAVIAGKLI